MTQDERLLAEVAKRRQQDELDTDPDWAWRCSIPSDEPEDESWRGEYE